MNESIPVPPSQESFQMQQPFYYPQSLPTSSSLSTETYPVVNQMSNFENYTIPDDNYLLSAIKEWLKSPNPESLFALEAKI
ncbi:unnamed protein product [Larinioides sclopetarius]|uniref:Uncharacterized protein n=1 Tax=Larinioides sclopetarius TaxID=280406 RepID=A0AAV2AQJ4_9ARAC